MKSLLVQNEDELASILQLLKASKLPHEDIALDACMLVAYRNDQGNLIGSAGLELYSESALLRSVALEKNYQGRGLGKEIVQDVLQRAKGKSIRRIYLLTETARDFFLAVGFRDISRDQVPPLVRSSSEFSSVCPVSAACLVYTID